MDQYWQVYALGSAFFAGLTAILAKSGVMGMPSNVATFIRTILISLFLGIWLALRSQWVDLSMVNHKSLVFLALSALTTGLSWLLYFRALQMGNVSSVTAIDKMSLPFAVILSVLFLGEHLGGWQWLGVVFILVGALLMALK